MRAWRALDGSGTLYDRIARQGEMTYPKHEVGSFVKRNPPADSPDDSLFEMDAIYR